MITQLLEFLASMLMEHHRVITSMDRRLSRQFLKQRELQRRLRYLESRLPD